MRLSNLILPNEGLKLEGPDTDIAGITADSREVKQGYLFAAVPGTQQDGRKYISDAVAKGAAALLIPEDSLPPAPYPVSIVTAPDIRTALSTVASLFYPLQPKHIAAVTGTSGKTSIAQFTRELWQNNGHSAASLGTLGFVTPGEARYGALTTPDSITLHKVLNEAAERNITHLAMEASSHGLDLGRLEKVKIQVAAFTNLSRDHLDYHPDMQNYLAAKLRLFNDIMPEGGTAVLNADVPEYEQLKKVCERKKHRTLSYGKNGQELQLIDYRLQDGGQIIRIKVMGKDHEVSLPVAGEFQIWNSLCALGMVIGSGDDPAKSIESLEKVTTVPGRLQLIGTSPDGGFVFVDYAHKPGALENVLTAMKKQAAASAGRLHVVFGCGGNRDKGKRPQMGAIAQRIADIVIVTDDNPRKEIPAEIRKDILAGCAPGPNLREIGDRAEAIRTAISELTKGDILVIAGKGHETGQIVGDKILPFDDADIARQAINGTK